MSNVIDFPGPISYVMEGEEIVGVTCTCKDGVLSLMLDGSVPVQWGKISRDNMNRLLIAWLALDNPEVLRFDE